MWQYTGLIWQCQDLHMHHHFSRVYGIVSPVRANTERTGTVISVLEAMALFQPTLKPWAKIIIFFLGHKILIPQPKVRKTGNQNLTSMFLLGHYFSLSFPTLTLSEIMYIRIEIPCILFLSMMIFQMRKEWPVRSDTVNLETLSIGSIERDEMHSHVRECSSSTTVADAWAKGLRVSLKGGKGKHKPPVQV